VKALWILLIFSLWNSDCNGESWWRRNFHKPTWAELQAEYLPHCTNAQDVCRLVKRHVGWEAEIVDKWENPQTTWERGYGDCDDFAILVQSLCMEIGIESHVRLFYPMSGKEGHAVVVGDKDSWMSSNGEYVQTNGMDEIRKQLSWLLYCKPQNMWDMGIGDTIPHNSGNLM
jgi:predicted transglutaminase-like cysteine proteinase